MVELIGVLRGAVSAMYSVSFGETYDSNPFISGCDCTISLIEEEEDGVFTLSGSGGEFTRREVAENTKCLIEAIIVYGWSVINLSYRGNVDINMSCDVSEHHKSAGHFGPDFSKN